MCFTASAARFTLCHYRCADTFANYLAYARIGTLLVNGCDKAFDEKMVLRRAREAIKKRGLFTPRPKQFLRFRIVQDMVDHAARLPEFASTAMWALTAYTFMLRYDYFASCCMIHDYVFGLAGSHPNVCQSTPEQVIA